MLLKSYVTGGGFSLVSDNLQQRKTLGGKNTLTNCEIKLVNKPEIHWQTVE